MTTDPTDEAFWSRVEVTGFCWNWTGATDSYGYGKFSSRSHLRPAHRVSYEALVGPIPLGLNIDHLCRNRACVNPDHLEPVSQHENVMRGRSFASENATKTHCVNGHEFTPENTRMDGRSRKCIECNRTTKRRMYAERKQVRVLSALGMTEEGQ